MGRCVECMLPLVTRRALYCSDSCRWRFHGRFFWDAARVVVMRRDRYTCQGCHTRMRRRELEVDHILEIARGGPSLDYANLQTLCRRCHRQKTAEFLRNRRSQSRERRTILADPVFPGARFEASDWFPA
jgi:5-methylcytosine-specific restriction protein A